MLKYLFTVEYTDGSVFKQDKKDISTLDSTRSAFYDVLQSSKEIRKFTLHRFLDSWSIDLKTGVFVHNGYEFQLEWNIKPVKRELIFQRQREQDMNVTYHLDTGKTKSLVPSEVVRTKYFLGYKSGEREFLIGIR